MNNYFFQDRIFTSEVDFLTLNGYKERVSSDFFKRNECFIPLSAAQKLFYDENPTATAFEVERCQLLTAEEKREKEYEKRIPRSKLDAFLSYTAEGKTAEANAIAQEIKAIKQQIRTEIPDETGQ